MPTDQTPEQYSVQLHQQILANPGQVDQSLIDDFEKRNEYVWNLVRQKYGAQAFPAGDLMDKTLPEDRFVKDTGRALFMEHERINPKTKEVNRFDATDMIDIATQSNGRALETKAFAALSEDHTRPGEDRPHMGWTGNFRIGMVGNKKFGIYSDEYFPKEKIQVAKQMPQRSVELLQNPTTGQRFINPVAMLKGKAPYLPLPNKYSMEESGQPELVEDHGEEFIALKYEISREFEKTDYMAPAIAGAVGRAALGSAARGAISGGGEEYSAMQGAPVQPGGSNMQMDPLAGNQVKPAPKTLGFEAGGPPEPTAPAPQSPMPPKPDGTTDETAQQLYLMMDQHPTLQELGQLLPQMRQFLSGQTQTEHPDLMQTNAEGADPMGGMPAQPGPPMADPGGMGAQPAPGPAPAGPGAMPPQQPEPGGMDQFNFEHDQEFEEDMKPEQYQALENRANNLEDANKALSRRLAEMEIQLEDEKIAQKQQARESFIRSKYDAYGDTLFQDLEVTVAKYANLDDPVSDEVWSEFESSTVEKGELLTQYAAQQIPQGSMPAARKANASRGQVEQRAAEIYNEAMRAGTARMDLGTHERIAHYQAEAEAELTGVEKITE